MEPSLIFYDDTKTCSKSKLKKSLITYLDHRLDCIENNARLPNFPEFLSENLVKLMILKKDSSSDVCRAKDIKRAGDLYSNTEGRIEVKCFSSKGPISFGPNEPWDTIYFLDASDCANGNYTCYKICLDSKSDVIQNLKVSSTETFFQQTKNKRRPRITWEIIESQVPKSYIHIVFKGHLDQVIN